MYFCIMISAHLQPYYPKMIEILKAHRVQYAALFGSVCTDRFGPDSDVDLLIEFDSIPEGTYALNMWSLEEQLTNLFSRKVDLVKKDTLRNPYLLASINRSLEVVYE
jgi:uncharacterized protein